MKPTKADIADALKSTFNESMAGDYWTDKEQQSKGWWSKEISDTTQPAGKPHQFWIGDFLVTVSKPRIKESDYVNADNLFDIAYIGD